MGAIVEGGWVGSRVPGGRVAGVGALAKGLVVGVAAGVGASLEADGGTTDNGDGASELPGAVVPAKGAGAAEHAATMRTTRVTQEPTAWVRICFTLPFGSGPHPAARVAYRAFDLVDDTRVLARMAGLLGESAKPTMTRPCAAATASRARALGCRLCRHLHQDPHHHRYRDHRRIIVQPPGKRGVSEDNRCHELRRSTVIWQELDAADTEKAALAWLAGRTLDLHALNRRDEPLIEWFARPWQRLVELKPVHHENGFVDEILEPSEIDRPFARVAEQLFFAVELVPAVELRLHAVWPHAEPVSDHQ